VADILKAKLSKRCHPNYIKTKQPYFKEAPLIEEPLYGQIFLVAGLHFFEQRVTTELKLPRDETDRESDDEHDELEEDDDDTLSDLANARSVLSLLKLNGTAASQRSFAINGSMHFVATNFTATGSPAAFFVFSETYIFLHFPMATLVIFYNILHNNI
jgi:hypothetical protein